MRSTILFFAVVGSFVARDARSEELPEIPPLFAPGVSKEGPKSFLIEGVMLSGDSAGCAFRAVRDGDREYCAVFDAADGTPLFLSNGRLTLVYDVIEGRVVALPSSRAAASLDWADGDRPLKFNMGVEFETDPAKLAAKGFRFRIDRFVAERRADWRRVDRGDGVVEHIADREGKTDVLRVTAGDASRFEFFVEEGDGVPVAWVKVTRIGRSIPESEFVFPDVDALEREIPVKRLEAALLPVMRFLTGGGYLPKMLKVLPDDPDVWKAFGLDPVEDLRLDADFGARYRAALAKQNITLPTPLADERPAPRPPVVAERPRLDGSTR